MPITTKKHLLYTAIFYTLLISTYILYSFGFNSGFFLDDPANLYSLANITEFNFKQIALFSLSGFAGVTGRPISLLSFALQYSDWPNNPFAFKYINLMIHLINTVLIFILSKQLFFFNQKTQKKCFELALLVTTIWAIHPIQVSTVLYTIQRMTELSATFVMLGIILYLYGRKQLITLPINNRVAYLWMSTGLFLGATLSILSKENGVLIFLFILVIEETLLNYSRSPQLKTWKIIFIYLPIAIVCAYFIYTFNAVSAYKYRDFSLSERLITENAVMFDYLTKIVTPRINAFSLYYDDFPISQKLTDSLQTLAGFLFLISSIFFSFIYRKKYPLLSFGFLWYYAGHILESSFIALELYFEHRNYLPLLGIIFVIVSLFYKAICFFQSKPLKTSLYSCIALYIIFLTYITYQQTILWGKPQQAKLTWALEKPNSKRAQSTAANVMATYGNYQQALIFTKKIIKLAPDDPSSYMAWLHYLCRTKSIPYPDMDHVHKLAREGTVNLSSIFILNNIVLDRQVGECKNLTYSELNNIFKSFEVNPKLIKRNDFFQIYSMMEGNEGHYSRAMDLANKSLSYKLDVKVALFQLRWLSLLGNYQAAYKYIDRVKEIANTNPKTSILFKTDIKEWEDFLLNQL